MYKISRALIAGAVFIASSSFALADNDTAATQEQIDAVTAHLVEMGYEVRQVKVEDGLFEAYVMKNGEKAEIFLNDKMEIVKGGSEN